MKKKKKKQEARETAPGPRPEDRGTVRASGLFYAYKIQPAEGDGDTLIEIPALNGVSAEIKKGEFVAVLGRNGSGKSTFAKLINALISPSEGRMEVGGLDASLPENIWAVRQSAGMVFQNPDNQIIATIVEEDVAFGPENLGVPPQEIRRRVDFALAAVGMTENAGNSTHFLSGGQKQRVSIAGVLAMKPDIIVLDEPTAMLDPIGRREVLAAVSRLNKEEGITIILITHYMEEAASADRVIVMDGGKTAMDAAPRAVFSRVEEIRALGLDIPQATEIAQELNARGIRIPADLLTAEEVLEALCPLI